MKVTDKDYYMEKPLVNNLNLMINRMTGENKSDNLVLIDGDEGTGKSNLAVAVGYYIHYETKRPFSVDNVYFSLEDLMAKALATKEQIFIWDEGALGGLATDWWNKNQKKFLKLLMVARKRKHFFIICIPKFFKLNEYIILDRAICLLHTYLLNGIKHGKFCYFNKKKKEMLYHDWRKTKYRNYVKYFSFRGDFKPVLPILIDEEKYEHKKDIAIMSIDKDDDTEKERNKRHVIATNAIATMILRDKLPEQKILAEMYGVSDRTIREYIKNAKEMLNSPSKTTVLEVGSRRLTNNKGDIGNNFDAEIGGGHKRCILNCLTNIL